MAGLTGTQIKTTYGDVLQLGNGGAGITTSLQTIADGLGNVTALQLSTTAVGLPSAVSGPTGADLIITEPSGHDLIFKSGTTECARYKNGGGTTIANGNFILNNGVSFIGSSRVNNVGGSNVNNYSPGAAWFQRWSASAGINVTGMVAGVDGETRMLVNVGTQTITLTNQDAASTAANQWLTTTGASLLLAANKIALAIYDGSTGAWRVTLLP